MEGVPASEISGRRQAPLEALLLLDLAGHITNASPELELLAGEARAHLLGRSIDELVPELHPASPALDERALLVSPEGLSSSEDSERASLRRADGVLIPVSFAASALVSRGKRTGTLLVLRDLREQAPPPSPEAAIVVADPSGRITHWSDSATALFGYSEAEAVGRTLDFVYPEGAVLAAALERVLDGHEGEGAWRGRRKDGRELPVNVHTRSLHDPAGNVIGLLVVGQDASAPRQDEAAMAQALAREREARLIAERVTERVIRLQSLTAALAQARDVKEVANVTLEHVRAALHTPISAIFLQDEAGQEFRLVAYRDVSPEASARWSVLPLDAPLPLSAAIRSGAPVWLENPDEIERAYPRVASASILPPEERRAVAALPLLSGPRLLGGVYLNFSEPRHFGLEEREFILALVAQCAQALDRARLREAEREAAQRAEESEALLDALLAASPVGITTLDRELRITRLNEACASIVGLLPENLLGRALSEALPEISEQFEPLLRRVLDTGQPETKEVSSESVPGFVGRKRCWIVHHFPIRSRSGEIVGLGNFVTDVTALKETEARLRESEARFRLMVEHAPIGKALVGMDGRLLSVNPAFSEFLGYSREELLQLRFQDITYPEDLDKDLTLVNQLLEGELSRYELEKRYVRKDGRIVEGILHASVVRDEQGHPVHLIGQVEDISGRKRAERERERLQEERERERQWLRQVLDRLPSAILLFEQTSEGRKLLANRRAEELMGRLLSPVGGTQQYLGQILDAKGRPLAREELPTERAFRGDTINGAELLIQKLDGTRTPVRWSTAILRDGQGGIRGVVSAFEDITALKDFERMREEWTSVVAHDLRQGVGAISFSAQFARKLLERGETEKVLRELERIRGSTRQLDRMVEDLLDVSRIEARRLKLVPAEVDLRPLVDEAVATLAYATEGHPVRVESRGVVKPVWADAGRVEQVLGNLISNAAKYGEAGTEILIALEGRANEVEVSVTNHGRGIRPQELRRLFSRFSRSEETRSTAPGLGLGLYISKGLVEAHGGRIGAESIPNDWTRFYFTLPLAAARQAPK